MGRGAARVALLAFVLFLTLQTPASATKQPYLVLLNNLASVPALLARVTNDCRILYRFNAINAIGLQIDESFVPALTQLPGVRGVIPDRLHKLHTTHSWGFLGLEKGGNAIPEWANDAKLGEGVIIANVDTGVWPTSESFRADGLGTPLGWLGGCNTGKDKDFHCNSKLIGASFYSEGIQALGLVDGGEMNETDLNSPRDYDGHGSHTLSTAGGSLVQGASAFGHGKGTAKGGSPRARVASYKACYAPGCSSLDILAAILDAADHGVHVLSLSVGSSAADYVADLIAIGTLYAVQKGVVVVASAGNSGPLEGSVTNLAPWILTVGASTMDRDFPAYVTFGANTIKGQSLADSTLPLGQQYPMIRGEIANAAGQSTANSTLCVAGSLDPAKVSGKIVVCTRGVNGRAEKGLVVKQAGGVGMVLCNDGSSGDDIIADPHIIAAAHCSHSQCKPLFDYLLQSTNPVGYITANDAELGVKPAPVMAAFSSRGPNTITPQILKPDITAPGVRVIAAFSEAASPTRLPFDNRRVAYSIESGTSMSCPHVAGVAGLVKAKYPGWTPAMIKSAIMTTASSGDNDGNKIRDQAGGAATPFSCGSGHVDPAKALDPGLVYDTTALDYANFICSVRPTQTKGLLPVPVPVPIPVLEAIFGGADSNSSKCSQAPFGRPEDLNYPSIAAPCLSSGGAATTVKRRVKNVGAAPYYPYNARVTQPAGVRVTVEPSTLTFGAVNEEKEFTVKLEVTDGGAAAANYVFGGIEWSDGTHRVWSPIAATTKCG